MKILFISSIVFLLGLPLAAMGSDDWGTWNDYAFKLPAIKELLDIKGAFQTRFRDDLDELFYYHFQVGPEYKPFKWLTLSLLYWNVQSGNPGDFHTEHRLAYLLTPHFALSDLGFNRLGLGPLNVSLQNQLWERIRHFSKHVHTWRYSIFPKLSYPIIKTEKVTISPYTGNDFYFSLIDGIAYDENRLYGGLVLKLLKHTAFNFYYMRLATRPGSGGDWDGSHIVGTGVSFDF